MNKRSIDFIFIGPSKTASTWLYKQLYIHPDISLPKSKEIYFFDKYFKKGMEWYYKQFNNCDFNKIVGEFSHDYILESHYISNFNSIKRIKENLPEVKLICCIRNPYERTVSGYSFLSRNGFQYKNLIEAISKHNELIEGSLYFKNISNVLEHFDREKLLILEFSELVKSPKLFLSKVCKFLRVNDDFKNDEYVKKINFQLSSRNRFLSLIMKKLALFARDIGLGVLVNMIKSNKIIRSILFSKSTEKYILSDQEYDVLRGHFEPDLKKLQKLLNKEFHFN